MQRHIPLLSFIRYVILSSFLAALILGLSIKALNAEELSPNVPHPAVARIMSVETNAASFGSGTLVYKQGKHALLITNHHVIRDSQKEILVSFPNGFRSSAKVVASDPTWDLAALLIWSPSMPAVPITKNAPQPGDQLTIAGYGSGRYRAVSGVCSQYVSPGLSQPHEMVELKAVARQGDSGGPIFNQKGELAGVLFGAGWRTTAGSYSGRVKKFLDPIVGRMQKSVVEKQPMEVATTEDSSSSAAEQLAQPQATITGVAIEKQVEEQSSSARSEVADSNSELSAIDAIPVEEEPVSSSTDLPSMDLVDKPDVPLSTENVVTPTEQENVVTKQEVKSAKSELSSTSADAEATLVDESYFESKSSETSEDAADYSQVVESTKAQDVKQEPQLFEQTASEPASVTDVSNPPPDDTIELPEVAQSDRTAERMNQAETLGLNSSDVVSQASQENDTNSDTDSNPPSLAPSESVIGWEQLAGETLLQQIRTVLAGIGLLAIIVQLARR